MTECVSYPSKEVLEKLYLHDNLTREQLSEKFDLSRYRIDELLKEHEIFKFKNNESNLFYDGPIEVDMIIPLKNGNSVKILALTTINTNYGPRAGCIYECVKCEFTNEVRISSIRKGSGCPVCNGGPKVIKGYNDIYTTDPHLVEKYFTNKEDGYKFRRTSWKKASLTCPDCLQERKMAVCQLTRQGFACHKCGDGFSLPNKLMFNFLDQILGRLFKTEDSPEWADNKRYDFSFKTKDLPPIHLNVLKDKYKEYDAIKIECNGGLGHGEKNRLSGESGEVSSANDAYKIYMANDNNEYLISIDCKYGDKEPLEYIKNEIINSELKDIFNLDLENDIDWNMCFYFAKASRVAEVSRLYNSGIENVTKLMEITRICRGTIIDYLKAANKLNLVYYPKPDLVACLEKEGVLYTTRDWADKSEELLGLKLERKYITRVASGDRNVYKGFHFKRYSNLTTKEKYELNVISDADKYLNDTSIKICCLEKPGIELNMKEWIEQGEDILAKTISAECIARVLNNKCEHHYNYHFEVNCHSPKGK